MKRKLGFIYLYLFVIAVLAVAFYPKETSKVVWKVKVIDATSAGRLASEVNEFCNYFDDVNDIVSIEYEMIDYKNSFSSHHCAMIRYKKRFL